MKSDQFWADWAWRTPSLDIGRDKRWNAGAHGTFQLPRLSRGALEKTASSLATVHGSPRLQSPLEPQKGSFRTATRRDGGLGEGCRFSLSRTFSPCEVNLG